MGFADLHIHSIHSYDGTASISAILKHAADYTDLDVIAITDHDTMAGVQEALDLAPAYGIEVIAGSEVSTADGHLLAIFINQPVPAGLSLLDTIECIGAQNGICIAAHPTAKGAHSLGFDVLQKALMHPWVDEVLVGVEAFNGGLVYTRRNSLTEAVANVLPLAQVGNSDAHVLETIGAGATEFEGHTAAELRLALEMGATSVRKGTGLDGIAVIRSYIPGFLMRKLGWVIYNADPAERMTYARLSRVIGHEFALHNLSCPMPELQ